jgi:hypothetical protein
MGMEGKFDLGCIEVLATSIQKLEALFPLPWVTKEVTGPRTWWSGVDLGLGKYGQGLISLQPLECEPAAQILAELVSSLPDILYTLREMNKFDGAEMARLRAENDKLREGFDRVAGLVEQIQSRL